MSYHLKLPDALWLIDFFTDLYSTLNNVVLVSSHIYSQSLWVILNSWILKFLLGRSFFLSLLVLYTMTLTFIASCSWLQM